MNSSSYRHGPTVALGGFRWACFVLAILLLYNPFFAVPHSGNGLEVGHPASHRAIVGASELQHFSPAAGWGSLPAMDATDNEVAVVILDHTAHSSFVFPFIPEFSQQFFGPGLWFRPPPAW